MMNTIIFTLNENDDNKDAIIIVDTTIIASANNIIYPFSVA